MKHLFILVFGFLLNLNAYSSSVLASSFGFNATDATNALKNAVQSSNDTIIVDLQNSDWNVTPCKFFNLSNKTIIFQPKVRVKAIFGAFNPIYSCLLEFVNCSQLQLIGYDAELVMNKAEYAALNNSEFRHCLAFTNVSGLSIKGLKLKDSGGDGIYIGGEIYPGQTLTYSENILIEDVQCINNYRQGMSVCSAQNMFVRNCLFTQTKGTLPEAGIDLEPYLTYQRLTNIHFEKCSFVENNWAGIAIALQDMDSTSPPVSIYFKDCYLKKNRDTSNTYAPCEIFLGADDVSPVKGNVKFERIFIDSSEWTALYSRKTARAFAVEFKDCVFKNVSQKQVQYNDPIFLEVPNYFQQSDYIGGYNFNNVLITYATNFNFFRVFGWTTLQGIKNIAGNFTIVSPNANTPLYSNVLDTNNVTFTYNHQNNLPPTAVSLSFTNNQLVECTGFPTIVTLNRSSTRQDYPLPVNIDTIGNVTFGNDLHLMTGGYVIPSDSSSLKDSLYAREDKIAEGLESFSLPLTQNGLYFFLASATYSFAINDCTVNNDENISVLNDPLKIYPNPSNGIFNIDFASKDFRDKKVSLKVHDIFGKCVLSLNSYADYIDLSDKSKGTYLLEWRIDRDVYFYKLMLY
jgi:hypothetical protein